MNEINSLLNVLFQTFNLFMIEKSCGNMINYSHKGVLTNLLKSIFPLMKLSLHVHIKLTSNRKVKSLDKRNSLKEQAQKNLEEKRKIKEHSIEELCVNFITILALFIYNLSINNINCEVYKNPLYILKSIDYSRK